MLIAKKPLKFKKHINVISVEKLEIALFPINVFFLKMGISKKTWMFFWIFFLWSVFNDSRHSTGKASITEISLNISNGKVFNSLNL